MTLEAVAAHKATTTLKGTTKKAKIVVAAVNGKKNPTPKKQAAPGSIDRVLPVPAGIAPYVPSTADPADPAGDAPDAAALRHRGDDAEDAGDGTGDVALAPVPPAVPPTPES